MKTALDQSVGIEWDNQTGLALTYYWTVIIMLRKRDNKETQPYLNLAHKIQTLFTCVPVYILITQNANKTELNLK